MPGLNIGHLILVMGIAFIVFGPARMKEIAGTIGRTWVDFQRSAQGLPGRLEEGADAGAEEMGAAEGLDAGDENRMTWTEHFEELRLRIIKSAVPILIAAGLGFFLSDPILRILKAPAGADFVINAFGPMDGFVIRWKIGLFAGVLLASPIWVYQLLAFILPGLTARERRFFIPVSIAVLALVILGTVFGYVLLSGMIRVMFAMFGHEIKYLPNASQYLSFVTLFMLACGLVFELPVVLLVLVRFGVVKPESLRKQRKIAYFLLFVFAEVITPVADPIVAPAIVMLPLVILYEGAIFRDPLGRASP